MNAWRLQELGCRFEISGPHLERPTMKDTWQLLNVFIVVCSWDLIMVGFKEKFWAWKPESELSSMGWRMWYGHVRVYWSEWSHSCCDVGNCHLLFLSTGVFIISFGYCTGESSLFFLVGLIVIVKGLYALVACDLHNIWAFNIYFL